MSIDPRIAPTFVDWAQWSLPDLEQYGQIEIASNEDDWQNWASGLLSFNGIASVGAPNPYQFSDWREWVMRFNQALGQGS